MGERGGCKNSAISLRRQTRVRIALSTTSIGEAGRGAPLSGEHPRKASERALWKSERAGPYSNITPV
jgi:hypothetical protein